MKKILFISAMVLMWGQTKAQQPSHMDKGEFRENQPGFFQNTILKGVEQKKLPAPVKKSFKIDVTGVDAPKSVDEFTTFWKTAPVSQGNTNTCWSFSTISYFESEVYRLTKQQVRLSEMYTVYWEYIEKAKRFVEQRGNSNFDEGSEANAVTRSFRLYGIVPFESYTGIQKNEEFYSHAAMIDEMKKYLQGVKERNAWNETEVISTIKAIMDHYMGTPPSMVILNGKQITPQEYLKSVLKLNMDDYFDVTSLMSKPYWEKVEYEVPDNWWHSADYYNVPLDDYMSIIKNSIRQGYTMMIGGDVSEAGFDTRNNIAIIPTFDIPAEYIDENAREFRFANGTTTDDHGLHLIGWCTKNGKDWYLIKDSGSGSRNCGKESSNFGYYFFREDYVKLKMMTFLVHKDMLRDYLKKFKA
jgi:bleomycin hydrolase